MSVYYIPEKGVIITLPQLQEAFPSATLDADGDLCVQVEGDDGDCAFVSFREEGVMNSAATYGASGDGAIQAIEEKFSRLVCEYDEDFEANNE